MTAPQRLTPHFTVDEFLTTSHRALVDEQLSAWSRHPDIQANAQRTCGLLERLREMTGPLRVTSGFRCAALNAAVGGRPTSRHMLGLAADVQPVEMSTREMLHRVVAALDAGALDDLDEAIIEMGWVHVQTVPPGFHARRLALQTSDGIHYAPFDRTAPA